ncbi:ATP synthase subunit I [Acetobacter pasteurianus]|uniref:Transmembrane protein n=1 Tax=Acetobacter pasteurianus NBRC 3188 TaxID=1226663 RepID=A0A401WUB4_ACEPA|nr:ATP synthase subunit I [Acetobacter pasteurianus]GCD52938.1 transmembrane protein [Acetobacter pasteurianus NBRC 3188]
MHDLSALLWLAVGLIAGVVNVMALRTNVQWLVTPNRRSAALIMMAIRFLLLISLLFIAVRNSAGALLWTALGIVLARTVMLRLVKHSDDAPSSSLIMGEKTQL